MLIGILVLEKNSSKNPGPMVVLEKNILRDPSLLALEKKKINKKTRSSNWKIEIKKSVCWSLKNFLKSQVATRKTYYNPKFIGSLKKYSLKSMCSLDFFFVFLLVLKIGSWYLKKSSKIYVLAYWFLKKMEKMHSISI